MHFSTERLLLTLCLYLLTPYCFYLFLLDKVLAFSFGCIQTLYVAHNSLEPPICLSQLSKCVSIHGSFYFFDSDTCDVTQCCWIYLYGLFSSFKARCWDYFFKFQCKIQMSVVLEIQSIIVVECLPFPF